MVAIYQHLRRLLAGLAAACLAGTAAASGVASAQSPVAVRVDGRAVWSDVPPRIDQGRVLLPVRAVAEALGAAVAWEGGSRRVSLSLDGHQAVFFVGSRQAYVDGRAFDLDVAPRVENGRTLVPIRAAGQAVGAVAQWREADRTAVLVGNLDRAHTVVPGESLWQIARVWGADPAALARANGLAGDRLLPGWVLYVPAPGEAPAPRFVFPIAAGSRYQPLRNNYGEVRTWTPGGSQPRFHEGVDVMAPAGTPLVAVGDGTISRLGWSEYGGWRVTLALKNLPYSAYYAHMSRYAPGLKVGQAVRAGQLLGHVGSTGYGPVGTQGRFPSHLHFGLYTRDNRTIDPFRYLQAWQSGR